MKVLVTGATGFVGARCVRALVQSPENDVHILVREQSSLARLQDILPHVTVHTADLLHTEHLSPLMQEIAPTHIFHFANQGVYPGEQVAEARFREVNTDGLAALLKALRGISYEAFVNVGSSSEYGLKNVPMKESDECSPVNAYGIAKREATRLATEEARAYKKPIATFRIFSPYGPQDDTRRLIPTAIRSLIGGTSFTKPHPQAVRDYVFVDDIVALFLEAATHMSLHAGEIFNVGRGEELRAVDVVAHIAHLLGTEEALATLPQTQELSPSESPRWVADMNKTFSAFSWRPTTTLEEGLRKTIETYA